MRIRSAGRSHAVVGVVDPVNFSRARNSGQLVNRSSATATDVENLVVYLDRNMAQSPIGQFGMMPIHVPQNEPAKEPGRLSTLSDYFIRRAHFRISTRRISPLK